MLVLGKCWPATQNMYGFSCALRQIMWHKSVTHRGYYELRYVRLGRNLKLKSHASSYNLKGYNENYSLHVT